MSHHVQQLRRDLDTLREAAGLGPTYGWAETAWAAAVAGAFASFAIGSYFGGGPGTLIGCIPFGVLFLVFCWRPLNWTAKPRPLPRSERRVLVHLLIVIGAFAVLHVVLQRYGVDPPVLFTGFMLLTSGMLLGASAVVPGQAHGIGAALAMAAFGIAVPLTPVDSLPPVVGGIGAFGFGSMAAVQAWQLNRKHHAGQRDGGRPERTTA